MTTVPHLNDFETSSGQESDIERRHATIRSFANAYQGQGWHCLLLAQDSSGGKIPPHNCPKCDHRSESYQRHAPGSCGHLLCHGFYAATTDAARFDAMLAVLPHGHLAIRTGVVSQLVVIDAEATGRPGEPSGLEVLEQFEAWTNGLSLPPTLTARSVSGGLHLFYRCSVPITSRRILPGVDVKGEAGYVGAVSGVDGRSWLDPQVKVADLPAGVTNWLGIRRNGYGGSVGGSGSGSPEGYDFARFLAEGCPGGQRDYFINDLAFRLRMSGMARDRYLEKLREAWEKLAQPPDADYLMPWEDVVYKAERVWATREPVKLTTAQRRFAGTWKSDENDECEEIPIVRIGTKSIIRRPGAAGGWK